MRDRGPLEPATRDGVGPVLGVCGDNRLSVHDAHRRADVLSLSSAAEPNPGATASPSRRTPRGRRRHRDSRGYVVPCAPSAADHRCSPVGGRWATVREPVLDTTVAALLWAGMAVDLATRPLTEGQSTVDAGRLRRDAASSPAPVAIHRRFPVIAMLASTAALVGYSLGRFTAFPGYTTFVLVFLVALHAGRRRALVVYLGGVAGLSVSLLLQPPAVATASSWISTVLTVTVAWLAGENLRSRRARRRDELDEAHRQVASRRPRRRAGRSAAERLRIARDLHDVVAHSMSVIAVQAGVAHHVIDERPEVARRRPRQHRGHRPGGTRRDAPVARACSAPRTTRPTTPA